MRLLSLLLFLTLLCASPLCLTGCDFGDDGSSADPPFAREMLSAHNSVRISATPAPNPALPTLTWSNDVAATAQAWADQCQFKHNPNLSSLKLGENIAAATPNGLTTAGVVQNWASESANYDYGTNSCAGGQTCGHYTQIVWRATTQLGCAMAKCTQNSPFGSGQWWFWVCDYSPPGNFVGQRPY